MTNEEQSPLGGERMEESQFRELEKTYIEQFPLYKEFSGRINYLIQDLLERDDIEIYSIEATVRNPYELMRALDASSAEENESLHQITDLVSIRVILKFPEDVSKVERILEEEFIFDETHSVPSRTLDDPTRFGYPAGFYTLSLSSPRTALREWQKYQAIPFQVEIRTMLQEVWASVSPKVNVVVDGPTQKKLQRKLLRLGALLEEADEGFLTLWEAARGAGLPVTTEHVQPPEPEPDYSANQLYTEDELYAFFNQEQELLNRWGAAAIKAGFPIFVPTPEHLRNSFEYLFKIFQAAGIETLAEVKEFFDETTPEDKGLSQLQAICSTFLKETGSWRVDSYSAIFLVVLNLKWDALKDKDLVALDIKQGSDRISGQA